MLQQATLQDHLFEPCGYSMNALEGKSYYTIHVSSIRNHVGAASACVPSLLPRGIVMPQYGSVAMQRVPSTGRVFESVLPRSSV